MSNNKQPGQPNSLFGGFELWIYLIALAVLGGLFFFDMDFGKSKSKSWDEFQQLARSNAFTQIVVDRGEKTAEGFLTQEQGDSLFDISLPFSKKESKQSERSVIAEIPTVDRFAEFYDNSGIKTKVIYKETRGGLLAILINIAPFFLLIAFWAFMMRRSSGGAGPMGGVFNVGKSKARLYEKEANAVTFKDVAGLHEAKVEIEEIVHFLKNPKKYTQLGGKIPTGALLVGPPGTGKTLLAKAVAGEAHVPFFSLAGSDFVEMFVGVGASRVRDLFQMAKQKAPCIIFIDEIDAVGRARGKNNNFGGGNDERENTLNQLLTEMDGFGSNSGIIVLAATNRAEILDPALLRAGRFDRQIYVDLPDVHDRKEIFLVHLRPLKIDQTVDIDLLARRTPGFSGADIANICNEAALIAARAEKDFISSEDFMNAIDRIVGGLEKKNKIITEEERYSIALHEAGHATVSWFLRYANPLIKVTIVARGRALGAAWYLPEERQITTTQALRDQMCATLGGRAAEDVFLGRISTGAANDLEHTTKTAYAMVAYYGMSEKLPHINYYDMQGEGYGITKPYSDRTAELIDEEARAIVLEEYNRAKELLREHEEGLKELTQLLLDREVIYTEDVERILGKRQWESRTDELFRLNTQQPTESAEELPAPASETEASSTDNPPAAS